MKRLLFLILLGAAGAFVFRTYLYEGIYIASNSMLPTLPEGHHVFVNKWVYLTKSPERGDIVMFRTPQEGKKGLVKRVIAVGGDVIALKQKRVYLNGVLKEEPYVRYARADERLIGDNMSPIVIPEDHVFVMGDNRDESLDSRDWKAPDGSWSPYVPISMVKGQIKEPS